MSNMMMCDCCKKTDFQDSRGMTEFWAVRTEGSDGTSLFHLCASCYERSTKEFCPSEEFEEAEEEV